MYCQRYENDKVLVFHKFRPPTSLTSLILKIDKEAKKVKRPGNIFHSLYIDWDFEEHFLTFLFSKDKGTKEHDLCLKRNIFLFYPLSRGLIPRKFPFKEDSHSAKLPLLYIFEQ